jgi:hypothetical protein
MKYLNTSTTKLDDSINFPNHESFVVVRVFANAGHGYTAASGGPGEYHVTLESFADMLAPLIAERLNKARKRTVISNGKTKNET